MLKTLRPLFEDLAKASLAQMGADLANSPAEAINNAVERILTKDDLLIRAGAAFGLDPNNFEQLRKAGINEIDLQEHHLVDGRMLDASSVLAFSR